MNILKTTLLFVVLTFLPNITNAQFGVNFHQSGINNFVGLNYQIKRFVPEVRIGTDNSIDFFIVEPVVKYQFIKKDDFIFYSGLGFWANGNYLSISLPIGLKFTPFESKQFGFHIEVNPMYYDDPVLRGSWGIHYQFSKK